MQNFVNGKMYVEGAILVLFLCQLFNYGIDSSSHLRNWLIQLFKNFKLNSLWLLLYLLNFNHHCMFHQSWITADSHHYSKTLLASRCERVSLIGNVSHNKAFQTLCSSLFGVNLCRCLRQNKGESFTFRQNAENGEQSRLCVIKPAVHAATAKTILVFSSCTSKEMGEQFNI